MTNRITLALVASLLLTGAASIAQAGPAGPVATGTPTVDELAKLPVETGVDAAAIKVIERYVEFWMKVLIEAKDRETISGDEGARTALSAGFHQTHTAGTYRYEYAKVYAAKCPPALKLGSDKLKMTKEIIVAMLAASMDQPPIESALSRMSKHPNPAVRYWTAKGYRNVAPMLLAQPGLAGKMLATLERMGKTEQSGPVVAGVLHAVNGYATVSGPNAAKLRTLQSKIWLARLADVYAATPEMIAAYFKMTARLRVTNADEIKTALQLIADGMEAVSLSLAKQTVQDDDDLWKAMNQLLIELERRCAGIIGQQPLPVAAIFKSEDARPIKAAKARLEINKTKKLLKGQRSIVPRFKPARPVAAPTTRPAK